MAKILLVEDSDTVRNQVKAALSQNGHEVLEAVNGLDGLSKCEQNGDIQMIICDVNMPEMDGLTMCLKVRGLGPYAKTPIFMLTTESSPDMKTKGKEAGVMAWMVKPFNPEKLLMGIKKVLG